MNFDLVKSFIGLIVFGGLMFGCASKVVREDEGAREEVSASESQAASKASLVDASSSHASPGKLEAPVDIDAVLDTSGGVLSLKPRRSGTSVNVRVWLIGRGHTLLSGERPLVGADLRDGEVRDLRIDYRLAEGPARLAVSVEGQFGSRRLARVKTFTIREGEADKVEGEIRTDHEGRKIHLMKGD